MKHNPFEETWVPDSQEPDPEDNADHDPYGFKAVKSITFTVHGQLSLRELGAIVDKAHHLGTDARVTIGLIPPDRPGSGSQTRITVTEA